jgi:hypothetical protein
LIARGRGSIVPARPKSTDVPEMERNGSGPTDHLVVD